MTFFGPFRIGHDQTVHDAYHFAATLLMEHLAGSIEEVRIVPEARLGTEPEMLRKVIAGDLEIAIVTVANAAGVIPELGFFSLPYLFADARHFESSISSPAFVQRLRALVEGRCKDLEIVAIITPGVRNLYSVRPVESLDDLKEMRVRVMASAIDSQVWRSWGTTPIPMPFGQIAEAIRNGVVDAAEDTSAVYYAQRHYELAGNFALTEHQWSVGLVLMNRRRYAAMEPKTARQLSALGQGMGADVIAYAVDSARTAIKELEKCRNVEITRPSTETFKLKSADVRRDVSTRLRMTDLLDFLGASI